MTHDFQRGAEDEHLEAAAWHEKQSRGLGTAFVAAVDASILTISRDPAAFRKWKKACVFFG